MLGKVFTYLSVCIIMIFSYIPKAKAEDNRQIECLAKNAYFEARGEGKAGMRAVSHVVMNRVNDSRWPSTPCQVIYQKRQFSWTANKNLAIRNLDMYELCKDIARKAYYGISSDNSKGSKFFHSISIPRRSYIIRIGRHVFY